MTVTLSDVAGAVEALAPLGLAEPWDRVGLQVGDPGAGVERVLVSLDPSPKTVAEACRRRAHLLLTHHPLLLHPLERIDLSTPVGAVVGTLLREGVALYAAHTNLDKAEGGVNDWLAERLDLEAVGPLTPGEAQAKLVVTVPVGYEPRVRRAAAEAGAGRIGRYVGCSFGGRGTGTFTPEAGAEPFLGTPGEEERAEETRLEWVVPRSRTAAVRRAIRAAHPYEEPAIDVYPLEDPAAGGALGRIGRLPAPRTLGAWAREVAERLGAPAARLVGDSERAVEAVAVCGGSGADLWAVADRAGAQVLVTGDVKYHAAQDAAAAGMAILDVGHGPSERGAVAVLCRVVRDWAAARGEDVAVEEFLEPDPFGLLGP